MSDPTFFATPASWRAWLKANHATAKDLLVGFWKVGKGRTRVYSHERPLQSFTPAETDVFQANPAAWAAWQAFPPGYRKVAIHRVVSAKAPETRARRLAILIDASAQGLKLMSPTQIDTRPNR